MSIAIASFCVNLLLQINFNTAALAMDFLFVYMCNFILQRTKKICAISPTKAQNMLFY